jgi:hypothetical protein
VQGSIGALVTGSAVCEQAVIGFRQRHGCGGRGEPWVGGEGCNCQPQACRGSGGGMLLLLLLLCCASRAQRQRERLQHLSQNR